MQTIKKMTHFLTVEDSLQVLPDGSASRAAGFFNNSGFKKKGLQGRER